MGPHGLEGNKFEPRSSGAGLAELESNRVRNRVRKLIGNHLFSFSTDGRKNKFPSSFLQIPSLPSVASTAAATPMDLLTSQDRCRLPSFPSFLFSDVRVLDGASGDVWVRWPLLRWWDLGGEDEGRMTWVLDDGGSWEVKMKGECGSVQILGDGLSKIRAGLGLAWFSIRVMMKVGILVRT
ncbi:hypothetical protein V6N12_009820 [Hibiscus sabdariffa]|uniref:Uncharacterized protein n=1 Tax=Hibiscus sabdariffa TaxID=183260 RepID=A0ABR2EDC3_9ROSI